MTGQQWFLRYAGPCLRLRLETDRIDQEIYSQLQRCLKDRLDPDENLLKQGFGEAFNSYVKVGIEPRWSTESVKWYWHNQHRHESGIKRDVWSGTVIAVNGRMVTIRIGHATILVENFYNLEVKIGDKVFNHQIYLIEIL